MLELPRHHVPRTALRTRVEDAPLIVLEVASGFGKSTFATELTEGHRAIEVAFTSTGGGREEFFRLLRRALLDAGERTAASALEDSSAKPRHVIETLNHALSDAEPFTLVIEDAHHLGTDAGILVDLARHRPAPMRMVITARVLPPVARGLHAVSGAAYVSGTDLRFGVEEAEQLLRTNLKLDIADEELTGLVDRTAGWPAGLALIGSQLGRLGTAARLFEGDDLRERFADVVLSAIPDELQTNVAQLAHLPSVDARVAAAVAEADGFLDEVLALGLPLAQDADGRTRFPGALAEALQTKVPFATPVAHRAVEVYLDQERPMAAFEVLQRSGDYQALARLVTSLPARARRRLSADELIAVIESLPVDVVTGFPEVLIELARAAARTGVPGAQQQALDRAARIPGLTPAVQRAIDVERQTYELYTLYIKDREGQERRIQEIVVACGPGEERTLGRALAVQGQQFAWSGRHGEADQTLRRAAHMLTDTGDAPTASGALVQLGFNVHLHNQLALAEATFAQAVTLAGDDGRARATALTYLGEIKVWRGRSSEGVVDLHEAEALARATKDARAHAYAVWGLALHASISGDVERTVARVEQTGRLLREWMDTGVGATYVATMTDLLDRVGAGEATARMLARTRERRDEAPELAILAEFGVAARRGDPALAEELWADVEADDGIEPFERVRCRLLRAYAALRRDDHNTARLYRELIADGESLGDDGVPWHLEPDAAQELRQWWAQHSAGWKITLLGDFEVRQGQQLVPLPAGRPTELVMLLALESRPQRIETVIDVLWGEEADAAGRARLRQLLYRLRQIAPHLIVRGDAHLRLGDDVTVDLNEFDRWATRALRDRSDQASAQRAVSLVHDAFFDGEPPATIAPDYDVMRSRVRTQLLLLWDSLAQGASAESTIDYLERAHALDPADSQRTERLATLLFDAGRDLQAKYVLDTTLEALGGLRLDLVPELVALRARVHQP